MKPLRPLLIIGTRPEAVKMAPVVRACRQSQLVEPVVCFTGQHREMLAQTAEYFGVAPDIDLNLMTPNQTLAGVAQRCLGAIDETIEKIAPDAVVAQGDTTTVFAAATAAFFRRTPFVHVEAGLRTGDLQAPWPEEFNRRAASIATSLHCAPTQRAAENLLAEGFPASSVHVTGNTVVDALLATIEKERGRDEHWKQKHAWLGERPMVLVTGHRRENFGGGFDSICRALATLAGRFPQTWFVYPVHLNPRVKEPVHNALGDCENIRLLEPAPYPEFVWLMDRSRVILTDSGGVQEEAPSLGKPVLVMRDATERPEAVEAGAVELVGADAEKIIRSVSRLLEDEAEYQRRRPKSNPYGDGRAAERIVELMLAQEWRT